VAIDGTLGPEGGAAPPEVTDPLSGFFTPYYGRSRRGLKMLMDAINKCNLRCVMCHFAYDSTQTEPVVHWTPEVLETIEHGVLPHVEHALLSVGTEPLMWKGFPLLLDTLRRQGVPITEMITNGLLLTEALAEKIVALPMSKVQISLEGATRETYESVRINGDFDKFLAKVELLGAAKAAAGSALPRLQFNIAMMRRNLDQMLDLARLAHRLGVEELDLRHLVILDGLGMEQETLIGAKERSNRMMDQVRALCGDLGLEIATAPPNFHLDQPAQPTAAAPAPDVSAASPVPVAPPEPAADAVGFPDLRRVPKKPACDAPWKQFNVRPDGTVTPCCFWYTGESLGDLKRQSFTEVWEGPAYRRLRWELLSGNYGPNCANCAVRGIGSVDDDSAHFAHNQEKRAKVTGTA